MEMVCYSGYKFENKRINVRTFKFFNLHIKSMSNPTFTITWLFLRTYL